jgi:hypothetical protein
MSRFDREIDNEEYESLFRDFYNRITPVMDKVDGFFAYPSEKPHDFSEQLLVEIELLHMRLSQALYRMRHAEIREKLETREIDFSEFARLVGEIDLANMYKHI